jgi:hypothetical protein
MPVKRWNAVSQTWFEELIYAVKKFAKNMSVYKHNPVI